MSVGRFPKRTQEVADELVKESKLRGELKFPKAHYKFLRRQLANALEAHYLVGFQDAKKGLSE